MANFKHACFACVCMCMTGGYLYVFSYVGLEYKDYVWQRTRVFVHAHTHQSICVGQCLLCLPDIFPQTCWRSCFSMNCFLKTLSFFCRFNKVQKKEMPLLQIPDPRTWTRILFQCLHKQGEATSAVKDVKPNRSPGEDLVPK